MKKESIKTEDGRYISISWLKRKIGEKLEVEPESSGELGFRSACNYISSLLN